MKRSFQALSAVALLGVAVLFPFATEPARAQSADAAQTTVAKEPPAAPDGGDPFLWLEDQTGTRAMDWVNQQNARTLPILQSDPHYAQLYKDAYGVVTANGRIPYPSVLDGAVYNFWTDTSHQQGIWRRTTFASYASDAPAWTTVLDLDALSKAENKTWVFQGSTCNWFAEYDCLLQLSNGGEEWMRSASSTFEPARFETAVLLCRGASKTWPGTTETRFSSLASGRPGS